MRRYLVFFVVVLVPLTAMAQNSRSAVSITGLDTATCTVVDPCRSFSVALAHTTVGGDVVALTSAGYGPFTILQSVTVAAAPGVYAAVTATSGVAVGLDAGTPSTVAVRGLYLNGIGADYGVYGFSTDGKAYLENLVVTGFSAYGVAAPAGDSRITDSMLRGNGSGITSNGVSAVDRARVVIDNCRLEGNTSYGVAPGQYSTVTVSNSLLTGNFRGVSIDSGGQFDIDVIAMVVNSVLTQNAVGIFAIRPAAFVRVAYSTITQNTTFGLDIQMGAHVDSAGNNVVIDNAAGETFTSVFALK
jgi:hypothetical protein